MGYAEAFGEAEVEAASPAPFAVPDVVRAVSELTALKGIGPATALAILAAFAPEIAPFMSDENYRGDGDDAAAQGVGVGGELRGGGGRGDAQQRDFRSVSRVLSTFPPLCPASEIGMLMNFFQNEPSYAKQNKNSEESLRSMSCRVVQSKVYEGPQTHQISGLPILHNSMGKHDDKEA